MSDGPGRVETAEGVALDIVFDARLCIHSRFCVLQAPEVFLANTPGAWIFPDKMDAAALVAVARNCPSGAVAYRAVASELDETDPKVNTVRIREDGPYALNAALVIEGQHDEQIPVRRRTLCRCGASQNKPFCDGSHAHIGFKATGEPPNNTQRALEPRDGALVIKPLKDGPLEVTGPAELVSGTGRTFAKTCHALLCRCGGSNSKPFCDGRHASIGFTDAAGPPTTSVFAVDRPSLAEWLGGVARLRALTGAFYAKVPSDPLLAPLFAEMDSHHADHVADFIGEVFGGLPNYSASGGSHLGMVCKHLGRQISEAQRARWVELMLDTAQELGFPRDPAFRSAFAAYLEWGSKLALINSAAGVERPEGEWPMPTWGWGAQQENDPPD